MIIRSPWYARWLRVSYDPHGDYRNRVGVGVGRRMLLLPVSARVARRAARWLRDHAEPTRVVVIQGGQERPAWALRAGAEIVATEYDHDANTLRLTLGGDAPPMHHPV